MARRLALRVPHARQRMYIVRANQPVMRALIPRMPTKTTRFSSSSFNAFRFPLLSCDIPARAGTRD